jgi:hypothetical protein
MASAQLPGSLVVRMTDGRVFERSASGVTRGTYPDSPLDDGEIEDKFLAAAASLSLDARRAARVVSLVDGLEDLADIGDLMQLLRVP